MKNALLLKKVSFFFLFISLLGTYNAQSQHTISIAGEAQGTTYHITYVDSMKRKLQVQVDSILDAFDLSVSTYHPNSIISRVNRNEQDVQLDSTFIRCFNKGKEVWKLSKGAFDPTVYPLVNAWGFGPGKKMKIENELIDSLLEFVGFDKINLVDGKIVKKDPRVGLDFNAFAQGYSVDVVSDFLRRKGIVNFVVEIGGEVYAKGTQENGSPWIIGVERPIDNKTGSNPLVVGLKIDGVGLATSGDYRRFIVENGVKYAHHLDPRTGYPTKNNLLSATVLSSSAMNSDATATGILVMGLKKSIKYLKKHPAIQALLIYSDKEGNFQFYETEMLAKIKIDLQ